MRKIAAIVAIAILPTTTVHAEDGRKGHLKTDAPESALLLDKTAMDPGVDLPTVVLPEVSTTIRLSSSDMNRISCQSEIKEALTSSEKGASIKITGKDAFVKFKVIKKPDGKMVYATTPTEFYVVCGDNTYTLIAYPQRIQSQTIRLSTGKEKKIKENMSLFAGLPFEKKVLKAVKDVYTENIPESYSVTRLEKKITSHKEVDLYLKRLVDIEGEGMLVKEFEVLLKGTTPFKMSEKMFLKMGVAENPVAISLENHVLRPSQTTRVFIVEQRSDRLGPRLGEDLPVLRNVIDKISTRHDSSAKEDPADEK